MACASLHTIIKVPSQECLLQATAGSCCRWGSPPETHQHNGTSTPLLTLMRGRTDLQ